MNKSGYPLIEASDRSGAAKPYNLKEMAGSVLALEETYDSLFDNAPVMLHSIGADGKLLKVNQKWLEELGYEPEEVLDRRCTDFLTAESRARAIAVAYPMYIKTGQARSVGCQFVAKNREVLDLLLDMEKVLGPNGDEENLAAIYYHEPGQWKLASDTHRVLIRLAETRREMAEVLSGGSHQGPNVVGTSGEAGAEGPTLGIEATASFLEVAQDVSANLKALVETQVELLDAAYEQREEFLTVVTSIDNTLSELVSLAADAWTVGR